MKIGFTGSRDSMNDAQMEDMIFLLDAYLHLPSDSGPEFHHGDCVGADDEAAEIAAYTGYAGHSHPPIDNIFRAFVDASQEYVPKPYLERDRDIVDATELLIAAPYGHEELLHSGTWATIRYARSTGKPHIILLP